jgi:gluconolactonase
MALLSEVEPIPAVLARPHGLLEAPRFGPGGAAVYSDVLAGGLWSCSPDGEPHELLAKRRGIGGALAHADGGWVMSGRSVVHLSPDGTQREILSADEVCGYNDLGALPDGRLLAGVLRYRPLAGEEPVPGRLLAVDAAGAVAVLTEEVLWPNGIGVSPDGATVYVSDYARAEVLAVDAAGGPTRRLCASPRGSADGLAVDAGGGIWVALGEGGGIARFHADGALDGVAELPARFVSSLCFGGADMRDVLITTADNEPHPELGGTVLRARSTMPGLAVTPVTA